MDSIIMYGPGVDKDDCVCNAVLHSIGLKGGMKGLSPDVGMEGCGCYEVLDQLYSFRVGQHRSSGRPPCSPSFIMSI